MQAPSPGEDVEPGQPPRMTQQDINEHRARVLERKLNTPSTFADRKAQAVVPPDRQLVSMGTSEQMLTQGINDPEHSVIEVELFYNRQHPTKMFYRTAGGLLQAASDTAGKEDNAVKLRPTAGKARLSGAYEPSQPDPAPRPV